MTNKVLTLNSQEGSEVDVFADIQLKIAAHMTELSQILLMFEDQLRQVCPYVGEKKLRSEMKKAV